MDDDEPQEGVRAAGGHGELEARGPARSSRLSRNHVLVGVLLEADPGAEPRIVGEGAPRRLGASSGRRRSQRHDRRRPAARAR